MPVDEKVYELALLFVEDSAVALTEFNVNLLAQDIQTAIEDWMDANEPKSE